MERAHNLLNGVCLLGGVEAEKPIEGGVVLIEGGVSIKEIGFP